jgi:Tfp pilus assembly PilM family ATPase
MAVSQKSILIAEVGGKAGAWSVQHLAEFVFPEGVSLDQPVELGQALKQFLRGEKFSTREAVIGLPAKRLVTRRKEVPPAAPAMAASMLRLQAEGEFSSEPGGLVMDFAGETSATTTTSVLLMAVTKENVDQCAAMTKAAGIKMTGLTVTAAALGQA